MKWILTETVENLEASQFHYCFGYDLEGSTTWGLFSQDSYCGLQTDEFLTCMLSVGLLDWIAADQRPKEEGGHVRRISSLLVSLDCVLRNVNSAVGPDTSPQQMMILF